MRPKPIVVLGCGGLGRETMWLAEVVNAQSSAYRLLGFLDDDSSKYGEVLSDYPVLGGPEWIESCGEDQLCAVLGVGDPATKYSLVQRVLSFGVEFPQLIHPNVEMSSRVELGAGVVIGAGSVLTVDIAIHDYTWVNLDCTIGHDARLGAYSQLNPSVNISGHVTVGEGVEIGTGAIIIPGVEVGDGAVIGAAACVVRDVPPNTTVVGLPAKAIKELPPWPRPPATPG